MGLRREWDGFFLYCSNWNKNKINVVDEFEM